MDALAQLKAFYDYNAWANDHILEVAARLSGEELTRKLGASFDGVAGNLSHILSAQEIWLSRWTEHEPRTHTVEGRQSLEALRAAYSRSHESLARYLTGLAIDQLDASFAYVDLQGTPQERVRWQTMLHVVNHGTHHRAETAMLMTAMGHAPRELDYVFFEIERSGGKPRLS
jgi:uncharacterized damage-inducible protein DinB